MAEIGVGAGSAGHKTGTATPQKGGMWGAFCPAVTGCLQRSRWVGLSLLSCGIEPCADVLDISVSSFSLSLASSGEILEPLLRLQVGAASLS